MLDEERIEPDRAVLEDRLRDPLGRPGPEGVIALDVGERRPVVLEDLAPDTFGVGLRAPDRDLAPDRSLDRGGVPTDGRTVFTQDLVLPGERLWCPERVPDVGVLGDDPECLPLATAADHHRQVWLDRS